MATKKHAPGKSSKAVPKKPVKHIKKSAPAKKNVKSAPKKVVKPINKAVTKPAKKPSKPAPKKAVKPVKTIHNKAVKPITKPVHKKPKAAKAVPLKGGKTAMKPMPKKPEVKKAVVKKGIVKKAIVKKAIVKKSVAKPAPVKTSEPVKAKDIKIIPAKPVILPKIHTKTSRKYQPDFTKSVLDQPIHDLGAPIVRYSDAELAEFRELIQRKLESAKKELSYLQGLITRKDEMGGDNDDARYMTMEDGSMSMEREQLSQMASRQITFIDHLEKALMRIENKTYGICRVTGRLIDKARLRAVPHATLSIEAKMGAIK